MVNECFEIHLPTKIFRWLEMDLGLNADESAISAIIPAFNEVNIKLLVNSSQLTYCSNSTIKTLQKGLKYVQS